MTAPACCIASRTGAGLAWLLTPDPDRQERDDADDVLGRERAHLAASRVALQAMREATTRNFAQAGGAGGNALSTEVLKQVLYRRMRALEDDPSVPLFFGRLDYDSALGAELDEVLYVGRRHVSGELGGDPLVMDWRAPMAVPFYRASSDDPMGVRLRRRFGFSHGVLTAFEDEDLGAGAASGVGSKLLADEIERPRTGPMRDIVATIQPDQDVLVRSALAESLCIQGAPGTGKTAVGLHRAAYLLYAFREQLSRSGVAVAPARVLHRLLSDPDHLTRCADGVLDADEQAALLWAKPPRTPAAARWTLADLALLDELGDLLNRTPSLGHVVVDEAQDLSAMMLRAVGRRASTGSLTVLGDLAQATTPWGATDWPTALGHLGRPGARVTELVDGFRVPGEVIDLAARLLPVIAPGLTPPRSVRRSRGELAIRAVPDAVAALPAAVTALADREGTVGLIVPDALIPDAKAALAASGIDAGDLGAGASFETHVELVPASLAKGLEFDHVVLVEPAALVDGEADERTGLRRLYVCLTRAVSSLIVLHARPLPEALATVA